MLQTEGRQALRTDKCDLKGGTRLFEGLANRRLHGRLQRAAGSSVPEAEEAAFARLAPDLVCAPVLVKGASDQLSAYLACDFERLSPLVVGTLLVKGMDAQSDIVDRDVSGRFWATQRWTNGGALRDDLSECRCYELEKLVRNRHGF